MFKPDFKKSFITSCLIHVAIVAVATAFIQTSDSPEINKEIIHVKLMAKAPLTEDIPQKKIMFDKKLVNEEKPENTDALSWKNSKVKGRNEGKKGKYSDNVNSNSFGKEKSAAKNIIEDSAITKINKGEKKIPGANKKSVEKIPEKGLEKSKSPEASDTKPSLALRAKTALTEPEDDGEPISLETREVKYMSYFVEVRKKINSVWQYPAEAIMRGETGNAVVNFYINEDGSIESSIIYITSGNERLDLESLKAVNSSAHFPPIPNDVGKKRLNLIATFKYSMDMNTR